MTVKKEKKKKNSLSAFSILMIVLAVVCLISLLLNGSVINPNIIETLDPETYGELIETVNSGGNVTVESAQLSDFVMAIPNGFMEASDLIIFILGIGGFIGVMMSTGALEAGVYHLVGKMKGRENRLIGILMFLFSLGGTTYGMAEETIGFYPLITAAMVAAGFDTVVAAGTVLLGAGAGVLGSTINPFATGAAMGSLSSVGIEPNATTIMIVGAILWITTLVVVMKFVIDYAKKVQENRTNTVLGQDEIDAMNETYGKEKDQGLVFTKQHRNVLIVFAIAFLVMILSLISYVDINFAGDEEAYLSALGWSDFLTGEPLGKWYFAELGAWFILASIIIAIFARMSEKEFIDQFIAGAADLLSVALIIAVARGITVVMNKTHLDFFILDRASNILSGVPTFVFVPLAYLVYMLLSFLVPSTSGLAALSIPVMGSLANTLGFNPSIMIMIFSAACGLINFVTPTSGVVMGGLAAAKVEYSTYLKWVRKPFIIVMILNIIILSISMTIF